MHKVYKPYKNIRINRIPLKISKFKRPKWTLLKRQIMRLSDQKNRVRNSLVFSNPTKVNLSIFSVKNVRRYYFLKRKTKNKIDLKFENRQSFNIVREQYPRRTEYSELLREIYFNPYYNLTVLLRETNFFF